MAKDINALQMRSGDKGIISALNTSNVQRVRKLMVLGILPGMALSVIQKFPTWVFQVGNTQVALDNDCASCIIVDTKI